MVVKWGLIEWYIPGTVHGNIPAPELQKEWLGNAMAFMRNHFGTRGATKVMVDGVWLSDETGEMIEEKVILLRVYTPRAVTGDDRTAILGFAEQMRVAMDQEMVLVAINGEPEYV